MHSSWWSAILQRMEKTSNENYVWILLFLFSLLPVSCLVVTWCTKNVAWVNQNGGHKQSFKGWEKGGTPPSLLYRIDGTTNQALTRQESQYSKQSTVNSSEMHFPRQDFFAYSNRFYWSKTFLMITNTGEPVRKVLICDEHCFWMLPSTVVVTTQLRI